MAELQFRAKRGLGMSTYVCLLLLITMVTTLNGPAVVMAKHMHGPPSTLTLYIHANRVPQNATVIISASPSAANGGPPIGFGTILVIDNEVKETAEDSPLLGYAVGQVTYGKDFSNSLYLSYTYKLSASGLMGTVEIQGTTDQFGNGEVAITGGTGMFRWARGYTELTLVTDSDPMHVVYKGVLYLNYD